MLSTTSETVIEIQPTNVSPKGFLKFIYCLMIILGLPTFIFGGFILVIIGVWALFIQPKKVKKNYTVSYLLTENNLTAYKSGGRVAWSIPWSDIKSLYIITHRWYMPKSLGIKLNNLSSFLESINQSKPSGFWEKFIKMTNNKSLLQLSRLVAKYDIIIYFMWIDRSAEDFAQLLYTYMLSSEN